MPTASAPPPRAWPDLDFASTGFSRVGGVLRARNNMINGWQDGCSPEEKLLSQVAAAFKGRIVAEAGPAMEVADEGTDTGPAADEPGLCPGAKRLFASYMERFPAGPEEPGDDENRGATPTIKLIASLLVMLDKLSRGHRYDLTTAEQRALWVHISGEIYRLCGLDPSAPGADTFSDLNPQQQTVMTEACHALAERGRSRFGHGATSRFHAWQRRRRAETTMQRLSGEFAGRNLVASGNRADELLRIANAAPSLLQTVFMLPAMIAGSPQQIFRNLQGGLHEWGQGGLTPERWMISKLADGSLDLPAALSQLFRLSRRRLLVPGTEQEPRPGEFGHDDVYRASLISLNDLILRNAECIRPLRRQNMLQETGRAIVGSLVEPGQISLPEDPPSGSTLDRMLRLQSLGRLAEGLEPEHHQAIDRSLKYLRLNMSADLSDLAMNWPRRPRTATQILRRIKDPESYRRIHREWTGNNPVDEVRVSETARRFEMAYAAVAPAIGVATALFA